MSRIIKSIIDNTLLRPGDPVKILYFGSENIIDENTNNIWYSTELESNKCSKISISDIEENLMYTFNLVLSLEPLKHIQTSTKIADTFNIPLVLYHDRESEISSDKLVQLSFDLQKYTNIVINKEIANHYYLYNSIIKTHNNWDNQINEILFNN